MSARYRLPIAYQRAYAHMTLTLCLAPLAMLLYDLPPAICSIFGHHFPGMDSAIGNLYGIGGMYRTERQLSEEMERKKDAVIQFLKENWIMHDDDAPGKIFSDWLKGWFTGDIMLLDTKLACPDIWASNPCWEKYKKWSWSISSDLGDLYPVQWDVAEMQQSAIRKILLGYEELEECADRLKARGK